MNDRIFFDSNILIYIFSKEEHLKRTIAQNIFKSNLGYIRISTQVINEFINTLRKKKNVPLATLTPIILQFSHHFVINNIEIETIKYALGISETYRYSYFDSLIIASALENNCTILYSEDMHHNHHIENKLSIVNPFNNRH